MPCKGSVRGTWIREETPNKQIHHWIETGSYPIGYYSHPLQYRSHSTADGNFLGGDQEAFLTTSNLCLSDEGTDPLRSRLTHGS
jgi:hypothetical protein